MWISNKIFELFEMNKETIADLREELSAIKSERDSIKTELYTTKANFDWLRIRTNALEIERAQLLEKAYGIKVLVPELVRAPINPLDINQSMFEDMGEDKARTLGLPTFDS